MYLTRRVLALLAASCTLAASAGLAHSAHPDTRHAATTPDASIESGLLLNQADIATARRALKGGNAHLAEARDAMIAEAAYYMDLPIVPITAGKDEGKPIAPSGNPHDYVSLSPYWWPDPNTASGTPYVRRDGEINPERFDYDTPKLDAFGKAVRSLAFAYAVTGDERYAKRAIEHVRAWFVNPDTRMNPHMRYSQFVPGVSPGRPVGIIDTNRMRWVPDALLLLAESPEWTSHDTTATREWFGDYVDWLMTSDNGTMERNAENNHGTWFATQTVLYARYAGRNDVARELLESIPARIAKQVEPDGRQLHELERTRALDYSDFNIRAMLDLALHAEAMGIPLKDFKTEDGRSIRAAIDYLLPYFTGEEEWPYKQISPPKTYMYYQMLRSAARLYGEPKYEHAAQKLPELPEDAKWIDLILPAHHN